MAVAAAGSGAKGIYMEKPFCRSLAEPSAPPSLSSIPNNHRSYALQWFAFALIALVIYGLAVRKRLNPQ